MYNAVFDKMKMEKIEWNRNVILTFIEDYKRHRLLWDPAIKDYHVKSVKYGALEQLSSKYGIEVRTVRGKIKSLRSSFHREHGKVKSNEEKGITYKPMWFAYEPMKFILEAAEYTYDMQYDLGGSNNTSNTTTTTNTNNGTDCDDYKSTNLKRHLRVNTSDITENSDLLINHFRQILPEDIKTELVEDENHGFDENRDFHSQSDSDKLPSPKYLKRRLSVEKYTNTQHEEAVSIKLKKDISSHDVIITKVNSNINQSKPELKHSQISKTIDMSSETENTNNSSKNPIKKQQHDEYSVFGEYVGMTIRRLNTDTAKIVVKHYINNLLFEAEMGKYDNGILASKTPPNLYQTQDEQF